MKRLRTSIPVVKRIMLQPDADNEKEFLVVLSLMFMTILFRAFFIFHQGFVASLSNFSNGLVSPETLPFLEADDGRLEGIMTMFKPEYLAMESRAMELVDKGYLQSNRYVLMEKFYYPGSYQSPYHIYKRVDE